MKKLLVILSIIALSCSSFTTSNVYICNSSGAVAYHSTTSCKGLNRCSHPIIEVTKQDAVNKYGRRACKVCY